MNNVLQPPITFDGSDEFRLCGRIEVQNDKINHGLSTATAVIALVATFVMPMSHVSAAVIAITNPQYVLSFNTQGQTSQPNPDNAPIALKSLAIGNQILNAVVMSESGTTAGIALINEIRELVSERRKPITNLLVLTVRRSKPQQSAALLLTSKIYDTQTTTPVLRAPSSARYVSAQVGASAPVTAQAPLQLLLSYGVDTSLLTVPDIGSVVDDLDAQLSYSLGLGGYVHSVLYIICCDSRRLHWITGRRLARLVS